MRVQACCLICFLVCLAWIHVNEAGPVYVKKEVACEGEKREIDCGDAKIKVMNAFYGRQDRKTCHGWFRRGSNKICSSSRAKAAASFYCNGRRSCKIYARNSVFGDPCPGVYKYMKLYYLCEQ